MRSRAGLKGRDRNLSKFDKLKFSFIGETVIRVFSPRNFHHYSISGVFYCLYSYSQCPNVFLHRDVFHDVFRAHARRITYSVGFLTYCASEPPATKSSLASLARKPYNILANLGLSPMKDKESLQSIADLYFKGWNKTPMKDKGARKLWCWLVFLNY